MLAWIVGNLPIFELLEDNDQNDLILLLNLLLIVHDIVLTPIDKDPSL